MTLTLARQASNALTTVSHETIPVSALGNLLTGARQHEAFLASAAALKVDEASAIDVRRRHRAWQERAWDVVDLVGELSYAQDRKADAYSNLILYPAVKARPGEDPIPLEDDSLDTPQAMLLDQLGMSLDIGGQALDGHAALLASLAWQLDTPGECSMLGTTDPETGQDRWTILSLDELRPGGGGWYIYRYPGAVPEPVPRDAFLRRLWKPHPRWSALARSPVLASLPILEELIALADGGMASARSRLANAGAWGIPTEFNLDKPRGDGTWAKIDEQLIEAGSTAIREPRSAMRWIPFLLRGPGDYMDKVKFWDLFRDVSKEHSARIEALVARLERSLNVPVGTISGTKDSNHWNAWFFSEESWRHLKPGAITIVASLTVGWYRDALRAFVARYPSEARRVGDIDRQCIWFDASRLLTKPDQTASATEGIKNGSLKHEAWRRAHGFPEEDAPTVQQQARLFGWLWGDPGLASVPDDEPEPWTKATGRIATRITEAETGPVGVGPVAAEDVTKPGPPKPGPAGGGPPKSGPPAAPTATPANPGPPATGPARPSAPVQGPPARALTAAALVGPESKRRAKSLARLGSALGGIDHRTFVRLVTSADAALERVSEKAGGQLRSKANSTLGLKAVANRDLTRLLGPGRAATMGLQEDTLISSAARAWAAKSRAALAKAQTDALAQVASGLDLDQSDLEEETDPTRSRALSIVEGLLVAGFAATAADYLWRAQEATGPGEIPDMSAPRQAIRDALAVAGGGSPGDKVAIGTGPMVEEALSRGDATVDGQTWVYTWESRVTFPGHLALDGVEFSAPDDDVLAVQPEDDWVDSAPYYSVGDHLNCSCQTEPVLSSAGGEEEMAE